jgi:hypothetical protein
MMNMDFCSERLAMAAMSAEFELIVFVPVFQVKA